MAKQTKYHLGIEIDRLTNSILNTISGDSFPTDVHLVNKTDLKGITKKKGWVFNWASEARLADRKIFKLTIRNNPDIIQGLTSISDYKTISIYTSLKVPHLIWEEISCMKVFLATCLPLPVSAHGIRDIKGLSHLPQRQD